MTTSNMSQAELFMFYYEQDFWHNYCCFMSENIQTLMFAVGAQ